MRGSINRLLLWLLVPAGALLAIVAMEIVLRALPVSKGLFRAEDTSNSPLPAYLPSSRWVHSIGWDLQFPIRGQTNNYGQVSPFDYVKGERAIVVIGDSFIEGQLNEYPDTLQGRLAAMVRCCHVYSFGLGGNSLSDYLATARIAASEFDVSALVFFVVDGDIRESFDVDRGHYRFVEDGADGLQLRYEPQAAISTRGRWLRKIGDSSLLFYVFSNLRFKPRDLLPSGMQKMPATGAPAAPRARQPRNLEAARGFLDGIAHIGVPPDRIVLVLDSDRYALYGRPAGEPKDDTESRSFLASEAQRRGFVVVDTATVFESAYRATGKRLDFFPLDRHLNGYGNSVVAQAVLPYLEKDERSR
jgi:hypothetical protein